MADIELVVKLPEELLRYFNSFYLMNVNENKNVDKLVEAIKKGTPLPIGHGRLIDADELKNDAQTMTEWNGDVFRCVTERTIDYAPTIIKADKEGEA